MYKAIDKWLLPYLKKPLPQLPEKGTFLFCICDHFEPFHGTDKAGAIERVRAWRGALPALSEHFKKTMGSALKWTMFYPIEQYDPDVLNELTLLCQTGCAEVEVHLHHDGDTAENMADALLEGKERFRAHGLLSIDELDQTRYSFIHGNWAINNSHPDGKHCGVDNEIQVLLDWGCVADFTMPSAPNDCQTQTLNSIYYTTADEEGNIDHSIGPRVKVGEKKPDNSLLMVQGPLALNKGKKKFGLLPGIENGDLTLSNPPKLERAENWSSQGICVEGREDWVVVKLHTHGADPDNMATLLGETMEQFAEDMATFVKQHDGWDVQFVTARQLTNIIKAAEDGKEGNPMEYCDFLYKSVAEPAPEMLEALEVAAATPLDAVVPVAPTTPAEPAESPFRREGNKIYVAINPNAGKAMWMRRRETT